MVNNKTHSSDKVDRVSRQPTILIVAGGTGGHVYPALALALALQEQGVNVEWLGTATGLEAKVVPAHHIALHTFPIRGLRGNGLLRWLQLPLALLKAIFAARRIIKKVQPAVVVGFGGYVAGPSGIAARLAGKPLLIHEQNAKAGLTNRWLKHIAKRTFSAFPHAFNSEKSVEVIGNPLRADLIRTAQKQQRTSKSRAKQRLLIIGGSLGAKILNETVPAALQLIPAQQRPTIWHQAGEKTLALAKQQYVEHKITAKIEPYLDDMAAAFQWADLIICRAGAMTVSEVALFGKPAIFVPLPSATDNHQYYNCQYLVKESAGVCIEQKRLTAEKLAETIMALLQDQKGLAMMAHRASALAMPQATEKLLAACLDIIK